MGVFSGGQESLNPWIPCREGLGKKTCNGCTLPLDSSQPPETQQTWYPTNPSAGTGSSATGGCAPPPPSMTTVLPEEALHSARFQGNTDPNSVGRLDASFFFLHRCAHSRPSCHSRAAFLRFPSSDQETAGMHHTLPSHNLSQRPKAWVCSLEPAFAPTSSQGRTGCSGPKLLNIS